MKRVLAAVVLSVLFIGGIATAATVVTEYHVWTATATLSGGAQKKTLTLSGTITDQDTYPDPVTVTQTVTVGSTTTPTTTPPPPSGSVAPGQSWQTAYNNTPANGVVQVLPGLHPDQTITGTKVVTFQGSDGAVVSSLDLSAPVVIDDVDIDTGSTHGQFNGANPRVPGVIFHNVNLMGDAPNIHVWSTGFTWDGGNVHDRAIRRCGLDQGVPIWLNEGNATIKNLTMGPMIIDDTVCIHGEDIRVQSGSNVTIAGNTFQGNGDDGSGHVFVTCSSTCTVSNLTIDDNTFEPLQGTYSMQVHPNVGTYSNWNIRGNRFDQPVLADGVFSGGVRCGNAGQVPASWQTAC